MRCSTIIHWNGYKTSLLSRTSAMSCWSLSLPAGKDGACPLAVTGKGSISDGCYAMANRFNQPNVISSQTIRLQWLRSHLHNQQEDFIISTFVESINKHSSKEGYFRWFDSGDFFSLQMIDVCRQICEQLPHIKFWFPTRSWYAPNWKSSLERLSQLDNVSLRPSALYINQLPPKTNLGTGSTVFTDKSLKNLKQFKEISICPKSINGGSCESNRCRTCWDQDKEVAYLWHGFGGSHRYKSISDNILNNRKRFFENFVPLTIRSNQNANNY